jgi:hypothetical protein
MSRKRLMTFPGKLREAVEEAITGHKNAAQMVIIGVVLKCGGTRKEANQIALQTDAVSMVTGQLNNLTQFARAQLDIIRTNQ